MIETNKKSRLRTYSITTFAFMCMLTVTQFMQAHPVLAFNWAAFKTTMENAFKKGLGGDGMQGIGIAILVIGVISAAISFVVHKFNPQSRMPGWITCLVIGLIGAILMAGLEKPIALLNDIRDWLFGLLGI